MKKYILVLFIFACFSGYSQTTINNYKYVVVPQRFSFLKENDQYLLNSYTKGFLQDKGFTVYFDNADLPNEIANNKCSALSADVQETSGMFSTSLTLVLKDCKGNIIFKSKEGKSREKDYKTAYYLALKDAVTSLDKIPYTYAAPANEPTPAVAAAEPVKSAVTPLADPVKSPATASAVVVNTTAVSTGQQAGTLYAQAITNGYQLIDTTPKVVLTLLKTSAENYFIANSAAANGIVFKKNADWFFEYYRDGKLISEKIMVKF